ncbi:hypothetical protein COCOBI_19-1330 [Coccomyxa sp. Obi]|nr:hypothetical protein COCOBI_19-1330 [Coccomyxa sp. Obi]
MFLSGAQRKALGLAGKRKVGRPIAYCGDPNSPDLTSAERRRIMRRIANRESARRVRARRLDLLDDMAKRAKEMEEANARGWQTSAPGKAQQRSLFWCLCLIRQADAEPDLAPDHLQAKEMEEANARLLERLASVESKHSAVLSEAQALDSDLRAKSALNEELQAQVRQLRVSLLQKGKNGDVAKTLLRSSPDSDCSFTGVADLTHTSGGGMQTGGLFGYLQDIALPQLDAPQLEPMEQSFSEFLKVEFAHGGGAA